MRDLAGQRAALLTSSEERAQPAGRTAADGRPIVAGLFPDPSICRFGDLYVLAHSSFEYAPGIPISTSTDLVTWTHGGNALDRPSQLKLQPMTHWLDGSPLAADTGGLPVGSANTGNFAPTIRAHAGRLWLAVTNVSDYFGGPLVFWAERPEGPWSDPVQFPGLPGIDPDLFWDDSGVAHLTVSSYAQGGPHVMSAPVALDSGELLGSPVPLWHGTGGQAPESPHLFAKGGWLYLLLAEGGTERGHAVTVARARGLEGPWESAPGNPILTHRGLDRPVLNVGHADLVEGPDGRWAMVYLGVRARGFSGFHVNGRETFLAAVRWIDGWPVVDESAIDVPELDHSFADDFASDVLDPRWISPGRLPDSFTRPAQPGRWMEGPVDGHDPHLLLATRPRDLSWTAELTMSVEGDAGLCLRVDERHVAEVMVRGRQVESRIQVGNLERRLPGPDAPASGPVTVYVEVRPMAAPVLLRGPDEIEVGVIVDGHRVPLDRIDGRYLSVEVAGGWTGRVVGARVRAGKALLERFRYAAHATDPDG
ncbi:family 43 glycosylhydrolase [Agromyces sp. NPDC056523]|uniref:glycoside hydrolase family 43 protein n=1 Tax=Agromyces sp. NPDC056523 TaxID=3345850 RepID=UPI00366F8B89